MDQSSQQDSPLSIAANVAGILTFVVAIVAAVYVRITYLRNSDDEYFRVKASLSWFKTESTWLSDLIRTAGERSGGPHPHQPEYQMYAFVMDDLIKLEKRILELLAEAETKAAGQDAENQGKWTLVPKSWSFTTNVAMAWLPVRTKTLELVRQREALTARVQFTQMSMISSRIRDLESRTTWMEAKSEESFIRMENQIAEQRAQIHRLEDLVYRLMHRSRLSHGPDSPLTDAVKSRRLSSPSQQFPSELTKRGHHRRASSVSTKRSRSK
ncbi:hypothetical protein CORC01_12545 [Colletotrichum orchidophilum]|uniref:Uncharacterized protein n=1 Tax=Colletotrichum orchidophilum TaxID=1209926 RepID=A0A1G4ASX0_9PEZI|nr:uncharacterized protein CORC01_12545 [Colletotrichum orchidophilum]OHE92142.1 hypothetical protein CORC01_12545 [Colletotrichum orchidophilum]